MISNTPRAHCFPNGCPLPKNVALPPARYASRPEMVAHPPGFGRTPPRFGRTPPKRGGSPPDLTETPPDSDGVPPKPGGSPPNPGGTHQAPAELRQTLENRRHIPAECRHTLAEFRQSPAARKITAFSPANLWRLPPNPGGARCHLVRRGAAMSEILYRQPPYSLQAPACPRAGSVSVSGHEIPHPPHYYRCAVHRWL